MRLTYSKPIQEVKLESKSYWTLLALTIQLASCVKWTIENLKVCGFSSQQACDVGCLKDVNGRGLGICPSGPMQCSWYCVCFRHCPLYAYTRLASLWWLLSDTEEPFITRLKHSAVGLTKSQQINGDERENKVEENNSNYHKLGS